MNNEFSLKTFQWWNIWEVSLFMMQELEKMWESEIVIWHSIENIEINISENVNFLYVSEKISENIIWILEYKITWPWTDKVCLLKWTIINERYRWLGLARSLKEKLESVMINIDVFRIITKVKNFNTASVQMNLNMWYDIVENDMYLKADKKKVRKNIEINILQRVSHL
jgi:hypothetical protein